MKSESQSVGYGGVRFVADSSLFDPLEENPELSQFVHEDCSGMHLATSLCLRFAGWMKPDTDLRPREFQCSETNDSEAVIHGRRFRANYKYKTESASLHLADRSAIGDAMTALSAYLVERRGGFVLHATSIFHEGYGKAIAFVGPSGSGKTTAASQFESWKWLAKDRAAVFPTLRSWHIAAMGGGDPVPLEPAGRPLATLAAIFRVRRGKGVQIQELSLPRALLLLRESTQSYRLAKQAESERLARLHSTLQKIPFRELAFQPDAPVAEKVEVFLKSLS